ncbi:MAG TPA: NADPH-dependent FMN reductase [Terriglobales bacterium]|nr:NADPH-dependent FMN reductase [Terriglobales bacterium]
MAENGVRLLGIAGSLRREAFSKAVLRGVVDALAGKAKIDVFDIAEIPLYNQDVEAEGAPEAVQRLREAIAAHDGVVIVSPEYNYGIPGVLKNALDWASRPYGKSAMNGKHVLVITSSPGVLGGARAQHQVRETLERMGARPLVWPHVTIGSVSDKVRDGKLVDEKSLKFSVDAVEALLREIRRDANEAVRAA